MKLATSTVCYSDASLDEALNRTAAAGWRNLELVAIPGWCHFDCNKDNTAMLKDLLAKYGLKLAALHAGGIQCTSAEEAKKSVEYFEKCMLIGTELGASRLVFTGSRRDQGGSLDNAIEGLKALEEKLDMYDFHICIENHYRNWFETIEDYDVLMGALADPRIGITMDTGHFTSSEVDMTAFIDRFGDRVKHVHVKDHIGTQSVAIGAGETDNLAVVNALAAKGFDGYLSLELEVEDKENTDGYVAEAREIMEEWAP
ncbi:MAG: sugar phosphate isomerase/epimerase [Planctomycetes bacterium]|nr:sugar phosphate isomerase/epimerase [Planctomycetota bacterium]